MAVGDILEVTLRYSGPGSQEFINVLHYKQSGGVATPAPNQMDALAGAFNTVLSNPIIPVLSGGMKWGQTYVKLLTGAAAAQFGVDPSLSGSPGTSAGTDGPVERAYCFRKLTSLAGRQFRGRVFLPMPCLEAFDTNGIYVNAQPDAAQIAAVVAAFIVVIDTTGDGIAAQWTPVIFHRSTVTSTEVTAVTLSTLVGEQRRRRLGVGV